MWNKNKMTLIFDIAMIFFFFLIFFLKQTHTHTMEREMSSNTKARYNSTQKPWKF